MLRPMLVAQPNDLHDFCALPSPAPLTPEGIARQGPDVSWLLLDDNAPIARCSLWWTQTPPYKNDRLGLIGHYAADSAAAAAALLQHACEQLTAHDCTLAVGPMDGNTWQRYRFITERGAHPLFFLEPDNPDDWPRHFADNGFTVLAHYFSTECTDLTHRPKGFRDTVKRMESEGVTIRPLDVDRFAEELRAIHELSLLCFRDNFLYTPINVEDFLAQYLGVRAYVRPELVLIAEQRGQPIGYCFGIPDLSQTMEAGRLIDTVIVKTLAVHPDHAGLGLGGLLTTRCHEAARSIGYTKSIHALMHEANRSRRLGGTGAEMMRRYALFARPLRGRP